VKQRKLELLALTDKTSDPQSFFSLEKVSSLRLAQALDLLTQCNNTEGFG